MRMSMGTFGSECLAAARMRMRGAVAIMFEPEMKLGTDAHCARKRNAENQITREQLLPTLHFRLDRTHSLHGMRLSDSFGCPMVTKKDMGHKLRYFVRLTLTIVAP